MATETVKIVVVGDGAVGKTSMLHSLVKGVAPQEYIPTVFDNFEHDKSIDDKPVHITLWDTAGQEEYTNIRPLSYPDTNVFLVCFSVEAQSSFDNIASKWLPELKKHEPDTPFVIVGTKCDIRDNPDIVAERAALGKPMKSSEAYRDLAAELGAAAYVECSAVTRVNLEALFDDAVRTARKVQEVGGGAETVAGCAH
jgi:small GTP-binding protein